MSSGRTRALLSAFARGADVGVEVRIEGDAAHHLARVSRVREGDAVVLFDGRGLEADARTVRIESGARGAVVIVAALEHAPHAGIVHDCASVTWLQGYPKGDKLDAIVRQATELGARAVWPVYTARSVPRHSGAGDARALRLRTIAASASAQCGRADVPEVRDACALADALARLRPECSLRIVPWEQGGARLAEVLAATQGSSGCAVLVGPEGGLEAAEVDAARASGFIAVTLGPRVLRTETVAPALLAMLSLARGDLAR